MEKFYQRRYKFANLTNVVLFVLVVAGVSMLYGKMQVLQTQAASAEDEHERLLKHEADLSSAQATIATLTGEIEALRKELEAARRSQTGPGQVPPAK
jgi:uncharacterized protein YlxW (UPF0749 family)